MVLNFWIAREKGTVRSAAFRKHRKNATRRDGPFQIRKSLRKQLPIVGNDRRRWIWMRCSVWMRTSVAYAIAYARRIVNSSERDVADQIKADTIRQVTSSRQICQRLCRLSNSSNGFSIFARSCIVSLEEQIGTRGITLIYLNECRLFFALVNSTLSISFPNRIIIDPYQINTFSDVNVFLCREICNSVQNLF